MSKMFSFTVLLLVCLLKVAVALNKTSDCNCDYIPWTPESASKDDSVRLPWTVDILANLYPANRWIDMLHSKLFNQMRNGASRKSTFCL
jgi:hypothetical protein